jgi:hypothetical protein
MPGGGDDGMDAVFGTAKRLYPLITTTGTDVLGTVRRNRRRFPARRYRGPKRAIDEAGRSLKVTVGPIHDRPFFVERLYHHAGWRLKLLGISGHPPPCPAPSWSCSKRPAS